LVPAAVDIKPGSFPNSINPRNQGVVPVALLGSDHFDVAEVDLATLRFGPGGAMPRPQSHLQDTDLDGHLDLVTHYRTQETGIRCGDMDATLAGSLRDGRRFEGVDSIKTVGCTGKFPNAD
jgi:hypothetical protein